MYLLKKTNLNQFKKNNLKEIKSTGILVLENGQHFKGVGFGYQGVATGEVCDSGKCNCGSAPCDMGEICNDGFCGML